MDARTTSESSGPGTRAEALVAAYERAGYRRCAPPILQPAEPFLDLSGEDIRKRMYLTTAPGGGELCLRPDLTIPVSREYLASPAAGKPAGFCYLGPVFRHRSDGPAGIHAGRHRVASAAPIRPPPTPKCLRSALEATAHYGLAAPDIQMGDVGAVHRR